MPVILSDRLRYVYLCDDDVLATNTFSASLIRPIRTRFAEAIGEDPLHHTVVGSKTCAANNEDDDLSALPAAKSCKYCILHSRRLVLSHDHRGEHGDEGSRIPTDA